MEPLIDIFRFFAISQLLLQCLLFWRARERWSRSWVAAFLCVSVMGYLLADWNPLEGHALFQVALLPTFCLPFSFWLFSRSVFDDDFRVQPWWFVVLFVVVVVDYGINWQCMGSFVLFPGVENRLLQLLHYIMGLVFVILAIVEVTKNRQDDLVESRLHFRYLFLLLSASIIALTLLTELAFLNTFLPSFLELLQKIAIFGLSLFFTIKLSEPKYDFFPIPDSMAIPPKEVLIDPTLLKHLTLLMEKEEVYREEGLSIRKLAQKMEVKEYKLRQVINKHLGFRNFNAYLNTHRIEAACTILAHPEKQDLTILEIAFSLGYNSLAPFNKSFKQITGMTPTEWRKNGRS